MSENGITVTVRLDVKTFRRFALYDAFVLKRRWTKPVLFALLMTAFALIALFLRREQSGLIAAVLLAIGFGLPLVYLGMYMSQVNLQALRNRLKPARKVYQLRLTAAGLDVKNLQREENVLHVDWEETWRAVRKRGCVYLYVSPSRAFLLPNGQADCGDQALWDYLECRMGKDKCAA